MRVATILSGAALGVIGCTHNIASSRHMSDAVALRALLAASTEAENSCNRAAWLATIADDGLVLIASGAVPKHRLADTFGQSFCRPGYRGMVTADSIEVSGDLAVMWGRLELQGRRPDGTETRSIGTHIDAARRQPDGSWKFTWWMVSSRAATPPVRDSAPPSVAVPIGTVMIGSAAPGAVLYINGAVDGLLSGVRVVAVPAGQVKLTIKAPGCLSWDTTVTVTEDQRTVIGRRSPRC